MGHLALAKWQMAQGPQGSKDVQAIAALATANALISIAESLETLAGAVGLDGAGEPGVRTISIYQQRMRANPETREDKRARCEATHRHSEQWPRSQSGCPEKV